MVLIRVVMILVVAMTTIMMMLMVLMMMVMMVAMVVSNIFKLLLANGKVRLLAWSWRITSQTEGPRTWDSGHMTKDLRPQALT